MAHNVYLYILVMAGVTYLIRMLPLALSKKEITSNYIKSFLYYVPYAPPCLVQKRNYQQLYQILSVLCTICMPCRDDLSSNPAFHCKHLLGARGINHCCHCGIQRKRSARRRPCSLRGGIYCGADFGVPLNRVAKIYLHYSPCFYNPSSVLSCSTFIRDSSPSVYTFK